MPEVILNRATTIGGQSYEVGDVVEVYESEVPNYTQLSDVAEPVQDQESEGSQSSSGSSKGSKSSSSKKS